VGLTGSSQCILVSQLVVKDILILRLQAYILAKRFYLRHQNHQNMNMNRSYLFAILILAFTSQVGSAQKAVMSFQAAKEAGFSFNELDQSYLSAYRRGKQDTCAFPGMQDSLMQTYNTMLTDMSAYFNDKRFEWGESKRTFLRLYFNKKGELDYFFYRFQDLDEREEKRMKKLVGKFYKNYTFPMEAEVPFFIFGPAILKDTDAK
jgi:hypothetical protein